MKELVRAGMCSDVGAKGNTVGGKVESPQTFQPNKHA